MRTSHGLGFCALGVWLFLYLIGFVVPVGFVVVRGFQGIELFDPVLVAIAWATFKQSALSSVLTGILGLGLGIAVWKAGRGARFARVLLSLPFTVPSLVAASAWVFWLGRTGGLGSLELAYSMKAVILAHVAWNVPWVALQVVQAAETTPRNQWEAAQTMGASPALSFITVVWPQIRSHWVFACVQVYLLCSMSFTVVLLLGGGPPVSTLETSLYAALRIGGLDLSRAVGCALWQIAVTLPAAIWVLQSTLRERTLLQQADSPALHDQTSRGMVAVVSLAAILFVIPYFPVLAAPIKNVGFFEALQELGPAAWISLQIALGAALGTVLISLLGAWVGTFLRDRTRVGLSMLITLGLLPSGVSILVVGLGIWLAYGSWFDPFDANLLWFVGLQTVLFSPWGMRKFWPLVSRPQTHLHEAAACLGASP
ncbi:MAG: ABC transporter permease subunit, partial [Bdellovibrionota bacterium]